MYALAAYVMRGRTHAVVAGLLLGILPVVGWLSAVVLALVTLRRGLSEGLLLTPWLVLPPIGWLLVSGHPTSLLVMLLALVMAGVLRSTMSWPVTLAVGLVLGCLASVMQMYWFPELVETIVDMMQELFSQVIPDADSAAGLVPSAWLVSSSMAGVFLWLALGVLLLARACQAHLYNPGGFQSEFYRIRLPLWSGVLMLAVLGTVNFITPALANWLPLLEIPYVFAGISLVHGLLALKGAGGVWLVLFYLALFMMAPIVYGLLVLLSVLDSWVDFRKRAENRI